LLAPSEAATTSPDVAFTFCFVDVALLSTVVLPPFMNGVPRPSAKEISSSYDALW
jgi:hypothetical protein